jgi:hypothetical protein
MPLTGTWALAPPNVCAGPPSTVQTMSAIPDGLPPAVAVTYWVPAVDGASTGPESETGSQLPGCIGSCQPTD